MVPVTNPSRWKQVLLVGETWNRTRIALTVAVLFAVTTALLRIAAPNTPYSHLVFGILHAFVLEATPQLLLREGIGVLTMGGLAALHAYLNEGYVPSLLLASAPSFGHYVFNGPGAAPVWAAGYIIPFALIVGTLGFLLGIGLRRFRKQGVDCHFVALS